MSFDPVSALFSVGETLIERIWPDPKIQSEEKLKLLELKQQGDAAQLEYYIVQLRGQLAINVEEAKHKSIFVAGWRPFIGWVGGLSLAYAGIVYPILLFVCAMMEAPNPPELDTTLLGTIVTGMLGIGAMRSVDKHNGVTHR